MRRRRKNPISIQWLPWIIAAGVAYYLYNKFFAAPNPNSLYNKATDAVANLFPGTSPTVAVSGQLTVLMPDGSIFPANNLTGMNFQTVNGQAQFTYNGAQYALTPQVNNQYQAIAL